MANCGYIRVGRDIRRHPIYADHNAYLLFHHLCLGVTDRAYGDLLPGQIHTSKAMLASQLGWSRNTVKTHLGTLVSSGLIRMDSSFKGTIITIVDWDTFREGRVPDSESSAVPVNSGAPSKRGKNDNFRPAICSDADHLPHALELTINKHRGSLITRIPQSIEALSEDPQCPERDLEKIWQMYPAHRRYAKSAAIKATREALDCGATLEAIEAALQDALISEQWLKDNGRYIPSFTNWIGCETWRNYLGQTNNEEVEWT